MEILQVNDIIPETKRPRGIPRKGLTLDFGSKLAPEQILKFKKEILKLIEDRKANTPSKAAKILNISPSMVHAWMIDDKVFNQAVILTKEVVADWIEEDIIEGGAATSKINVLKGIRPEYRDNYNINIRNPKLEELLAELKTIGQKSSVKPPEPALVEESKTMEDKVNET